MSNKQITIFIAIIIGAVSALVPAIYGKVFFSAVLYGAIAGGVIAYLYCLLPRFASNPSITAAAFSPAGLAGAIAGCIAANASWPVILLSCALGWMLYLVLPAALMTIIRIIEKMLATPSEQRAPQLVTVKDEEIYGTRTIAFFEKVFDESMKIANSFLLDDKPSPHIDESDIQEFGENTASFLRRVIELEKSKVGRASPRHHLCKPISVRDTQIFGNDYVDLAQRAAIDWLNGYRFTPSKKTTSNQFN